MTTLQWVGWLCDHTCGAAHTRAQRAQQGAAAGISNDTSKLPGRHSSQHHPRVAQRHHNISILSTMATACVMCLVGKVTSIKRMHWICTLLNMCTCGMHLGVIRVVASQGLTPALLAGTMYRGRPQWAPQQHRAAAVITGAHVKPGLCRYRQPDYGYKTLPRRQTLTSKSSTEKQTGARRTTCLVKHTCLM